MTAPAGNRVSGDRSPPWIQTLGNKQEDEGGEPDSCLGHLRGAEKASVAGDGGSSWGLGDCVFRASGALPCHGLVYIRGALGEGVDRWISEQKLQTWGLRSPSQATSQGDRNTREAVDNRPPCAV